MPSCLAPLLPPCFASTPLPSGLPEGSTRDTIASQFRLTTRKSSILSKNRKGNPPSFPPFSSLRSSTATIVTTSTPVPSVPGGPHSLRTSGDDVLDKGYSLALAEVAFDTSSGGAAMLFGRLADDNVGQPCGEG